jgi:hypothetical protein
VMIRYESKSCRICYQVIDHVLIDSLQKSQKSLDFGIVPVFRAINKNPLTHFNHNKVEPEALQGYF